MVSSKHFNLGGVEETLKSLSVDRKLSCMLVRDYTSIRIASLKDSITSFRNSTAEDSLKKRLQSLISDSIENVIHLEDLLDNVDKASTLGMSDLSTLDTVRLWKRDIALRIVLLNNMSVCDTLDLQRLLFMWLDSPYKHKLPFESN